VGLGVGLWAGRGHEAPLGALYPGVIGLASGWWADIRRQVFGFICRACIAGLLIGEQSRPGDPVAPTADTTVLNCKSGHQLYRKIHCARNAFDDAGRIGFPCLSTKTQLTSIVMLAIPTGDSAILCFWRRVRPFHVQSQDASPTRQLCGRYLARSRPSRLLPCNHRNRSRFSACEAGL